MAKRTGDMAEAHAKAIARRGAKSDVASGTTYSDREEKTRKKNNKDEEKVQKARTKALEKEVKLLVQSIRLKFRDHTVEERIAKDRLKYSKMGSYLRNVGVSGVYGPGGAEKDSGYVPSGLPPKKGKKTKDRSFSGLVAAGSILLLVAALHKATSQSKILGVIQSSIGKALGLLVDLILLPFLPLITWGIIGLFNAIMEWNKIYQADPIGTLAKSIDLLSSLFLPVLVGKVLGGFILEWFKENTSGFFAAMTDFSQLIDQWNTFLADPLGVLKQKFEEFITFVRDDLIRTQVLIQNAIANSPIGKALGWVPENAASSGLSPGYHPPTPVPLDINGGAGTHIPSGSPGNIPPEVHVLVQIGDGWFDKQRVEADIERMYKQFQFAMRIQNPSG